MIQPVTYVGRFAPTPTGPLHIGSLFTAAASYLDAKANHGLWRLRIDDIDSLRSVPGAADQIQRSLEVHGLLWDGATEFQGRSMPRYEAALERLRAQQLIFYCRCSRTSLAGAGPYPGRCRANTAPLDDAAQRLRCTDTVIRFADRWQGPVAADLGASTGDFTVWRRDGLPAYALATAVDDGDTGITNVVRGCDLLQLTGHQIHLIQQLGLQPPAYAHVPVIVNSHGQKLAKSSNAQPLEALTPGTNLVVVAELLGMSPPADMQRWPVSAIVAWIMSAWDQVDLRGVTKRYLPELA